MKSLLVAAIIFCLPVISKAIVQDTISGNQACYWFYLKLDEISDNDYKISKMVIKKINTKIESGSYQDFIDNHKSGLKSGKVYIGPFADQIQAQKAKSEYESILNYNGLMEYNQMKTGRDSVYYFYMTRPVIEKWFGKLGFRRIPSKVSRGTIGNFKSALVEGLNSHFLAIGPFSDFGLAEKSKFIFRKNGEAIESISPDSVFKSGMLEMYRKWKLIKLEVIKIPSKKNIESVQYKLKFEFPARYFSQDVFQTIKLRASYNDPKYTSHQGITFQGESVADNNQVISFDKGSQIQQIFDFPVFKNVKITGFYVESFVYNNTDMLEMEERFLPVK